MATRGGPDQPDQPEQRRTVPELPKTWRPQRTRVVVYTVAAVVVVVSVVVAAMLPGGDHGFHLPDRAALVGLGLVIAGVLHLLARPKLVADPDGLTVVNIVRSRRLGWAEVVNVNLRRGDPWVFLDLDDGDTLPVMGIQGSAGQQAVRAAAELRALVAEQNRTERND